MDNRALEMTDWAYRRRWLTGIRRWLTGLKRMWCQRQASARVGHRSRGGTASGQSDYTHFVFVTYRFLWARVFVLYRSL